jgi:hypothetical protein
MSRCRPRPRPSSSGYSAHLDIHLMFKHVLNYLTRSVSKSRTRTKDEGRGRLFYYYNSNILQSRSHFHASITGKPMLEIIDGS